MIVKLLSRAAEQIADESSRVRAGKQRRKEKGERRKGTLEIIERDRCRNNPGRHLAK